MVRLSMTWRSLERKRLRVACLSRFNVPSAFLPFRIGSFRVREGFLPPGGSMAEAMNCGR